MIPLGKENSKPDKLFFFKLREIIDTWSSESMAFKCVCLYIFIEFFRPQQIYPVIDIIPWAKIFFILSLFFSFFDKKANFKIGGLHLVLILWIVTLYSSFFVAFDVSWSYKSHFIFLHWVLIFWLLNVVLTNHKRFYICFLVFFACCLKIAVGTAMIWAKRGFSFTRWGLVGPPGYFMNSGELAILMLVLFPLSYFLYINHSKDISRWGRYLLVIAMVSPVMTILGSSSRGAQIALCIQMLLIFRKKILTIRVLATSTMLIVFAFTFLPEQQKDRFTSIGMDRTSMQRILYIENGWEIIKQNPLLGIGYNNFIPYYNAYHYDDVINFAGSAEQSHNIIIQVGTDAGFIGLSIYLALLLYSLLKRPLCFASTHLYEKSIYSGLQFGVLGFLIAGQFVTVAYYPYFWINLSFQYVLIRINGKVRATKEKRI
ncbi:O-antigen ligase family protein [Aliagarivorans marinus]|uniref:O-antigen ligase family protein n=1 Tax=Aliagarivorans marinus TaxID=561965 RepID=UPI0003FF9A41|nr:O-antigen ligase family protein [Aliagarivorans marinus]